AASRTGARRALRCAANGSTCASPAGTDVQRIHRKSPDLALREVCELPRCDSYYHGQNVDGGLKGGALPMANGLTAQSPGGEAVPDRLKAVQDLCDRGEPLGEIMTLVGPGGRDPQFDSEVLAGPLGARMDLAVKRGPATRRELLTLVRPYLAGVDAKVKRELPVARRLMCHLIETRTDEELVEGETLAEVVAAAAEPSRRIRKGLRWY